MTFNADPGNRSAYLGRFALGMYRGLVSVVTSAGGVITGRLYVGDLLHALADIADQPKGAASGDTQHAEALAGDIGDAFVQNANLGKTQSTPGDF